MEVSILVLLSCLTSAALGFYICKYIHGHEFEMLEKIKRVENFSAGRRHGIRIATLQAKEVMGELKKYVTVKKPFYSPEHNGDIVHISFTVDKF